MPNRSAMLLALGLMLCPLLFTCCTTSDSAPPDGDGDADTPPIDGDSDGDYDHESSDGDPETAPSDGLPDSLPFSYSRGDGSAIDANDLDAFSRRMRDSYAELGYFDWVLRMSHGVDASTGKRDYRLWWSDSHALKQDGAVTIVHDYSEEHGGHNILKDNNMIMASALAAHLSSDDPGVAALAEQYCKGMSATMLGMVHDDSDAILHIMSRNIVTFNHRYTTHDGYEKSIDYSNWFFSYDRWNCSRFLYADNPYWGEVWVTNTRSKDGVGYLFNAAALVRYAQSRSSSEAVRAACTETFELLQRFGRDIIENGYQIRTKDGDGMAYIPGPNTGPEEADTGDLASFVTYDEIFPDAECMNKQAVYLLAEGAPGDTNCPAFGGHPDYERLSIKNNAPNGHIMRAFHIASIRWALLMGYNELARTGLGGLEQRFERDVNYNMDEVSQSPERWQRDLAINWIQAAASGYPLTADEVRQIQGYFISAANHFAAFERWNLWDETLDDGEYDWIPPSSETVDEQTVYWMPASAFGMLYEYCWSPFKNPGGQALVNCDILLGDD